MEQNDIKTETSPQDATTVGMFLKYTRQSQKKSIETVSKALCIRKIYIKAIEENNFDEITDYSVVTFNYKDEGTIAIIGPKRMDYSRVISYIRYLLDN